jgi:glutamyl-tRNA reductase
MYLVMCGVNHKTAPIEVLERFSISNEHLENALHLLKKITSALEYAILSTCNRTELYLVYEDIPSAEKRPELFFQRYFSPTFSDLKIYLMRLENDEAIRHLFRVASSLDSLIVGEPQILGQVKDFYFIDFFINNYPLHFIISYHT